METIAADVRARQRFDFKVNDALYDVGDPVPEARQILHKAGFTPADECVLIQVLDRGTRLVALDETVDLRQSGTENFWAFKSDRIFRFTLEGQEFVWGDEKITEPMLRGLGHVGDDMMIFLERADERDRLLGPDDHVSLNKPGTEHLRVKPRLITVYYNDEPRPEPRGTYTTEQLMTLFGVEAGYVLNVVGKDDQLRELKPGEHEHLKEGMRFYSQVPCGGTS